MQTIETSKKLNLAINCMENLLNSKDSDRILNAIKNYKKNKTVDNNIAIDFKQFLK